MSEAEVDAMLKDAFADYVDLAPNPNDKRSLWDQEMADYKPSYPHTYGPPSERAEHAKAPEAEAARNSVRDFKSVWRTEHGVVEIELDEEGQIIEPEEAPPAQQIVALVDPADADLTAASMVKFRKLADSYGLLTIVHVTKVRVADEMYAASSKQKGQVKKPGYDMECVFITITNLLDFAAQASWSAGEFKGARIGGKRSGHRPEMYIPKSTATMEEIAQCLK